MSARLCIPLVVLLLAGACTGDDAVTVLGPSTTTEFPTAAVATVVPTPVASIAAGLRDAAVFDNATATAAVDALVASYGDEGAFAVGVFALERGYDVFQVMTGAVANSIDKDGTIEAITPATAPLGLVIIDPSSVRFVSHANQARTDPVTISDFQGQLALASNEVLQSADAGSIEVRGALLLATLLGLLANFGVEPARVIEAIILGGSVWDMADLDDELETEEEEVQQGLTAGQAPTFEVLRGSGELVTVDRGRAKTCPARLENIEARFIPEGDGFRVELTYVRTAFAGVPPGTLGEGDPGQYVKCLESDKRTRHSGTFDVELGVVTLNDVDIVRPLMLTVSDDGVATLEGVLSATDFLNDWTLDLTVAG